MDDKLEGKLMSVAKVGEKGQVVIPKDMREMFNIKPGDTILFLADKERGIAIVSNEDYMKFAQSIFEAQKNPFGNE
ncbi:AbrB/MazE/SpoVT family DNA-binding domain-containing protein [Haploplasma axanthum]|uniref:Transcriptional regulator, AbrB family n=1 Tax=Haploplasma axanthum TaxID=29552 RepID=A0A449BDQ8_HAPAX|nr:AbrB/MazE/SpoVT family DNA-binding domain-containing protein [Haploplasma axanthum]VEU80594.1 transcriptional regulator, AbrB family [Haploplasma axanthum]